MGMRAAAISRAPVSFPGGVVQPNTSMLELSNLPIARTWQCPPGQYWMRMADFARTQSSVLNLACPIREGTDLVLIGAVF